MVDHTANSMDRDLTSIADKIEKMGSMAGKMLAMAIDAMVHHDSELARSTIAIDKQLDALQHQIQEQAVIIIARRQPVGIDLRLVLGAMRISGDLERIGDLSKNIARRSIIISKSKIPPVHILGSGPINFLADHSIH